MDSRIKMFSIVDVKEGGIMCGRAFGASGQHDAMLGITDPK